MGICHQPGKDQCGSKSTSAPFLDTFGYFWQFQFRAVQWFHIVVHSALPCFATWWHEGMKQRKRKGRATISVRLIHLCNLLRQVVQANRSVMEWSRHQTSFKMQQCHLAVTLITSFEALCHTIAILFWFFCNSLCGFATGDQVGDQWLVSDRLRVACAISNMVLTLLAFVWAALGQLLHHLLAAKMAIANVAENTTNLADKHWRRSSTCIVESWLELCIHWHTCEYMWIHVDTCAYKVTGHTDWLFGFGHSSLSFAQNWPELKETLPSSRLSVRRISSFNLRHCAPMQHL